MEDNVIIDEEDMHRLLRLLYNGRRPRRVHTLVCVCGTVADLRKSARAWNGWRILPHPKCPACLEAQLPMAEFTPEYPMRALVRFSHLVDLLQAETARVEKES